MDLQPFYCSYKNCVAVFNFVIASSVISYVYDFALSGQYMRVYT